MWQEITSVRNPRVKAVCKLREREHRVQTGTTIAEGIKELSRAADAGLRAQAIFMCPRWCPWETAEEFAKRLQVSPAGKIVVSELVYRAIAFGDRQDGLLAVVEVPCRSLKDLPTRQEGLYLILEGIEKPGNLGAIFRTADAAGVQGVLLVDAPCDPWNPNAIRASVGTVFTVPFASANAQEAIGWVKNRDLQLVGADPERGHLLWDLDFRRGTAIVLGAEHSGLSAVWKRVGCQLARIPMYGRGDSLNVSVAAAVFLYEAVRQRQAR
jgi:TrmH family RNA methyltransferase